MRDRLEEHAGDGRMIDSETDDLPDLGLVQVPLHRGRQRDADAGLGAAVEGEQLLLGQGLSPDRHLGRVAEAVELEVDVHADLGQGGSESRIARKADPVGVQHH